MRAGRDLKNSQRLRRNALNRCLTGAILLLVACGEPDYGAPTAPEPLPQLGFADIPPYVELRVGDSFPIRIVTTLAVHVTHTMESQTGKVSIRSGSTVSGIVDAVVFGMFEGRDTIIVTVSAPGYRPASAEIPVWVEPRVIWTPPPNPPDPPDDIDPELLMWRQLVFNAYECPTSGSCPAFYPNGAAVESRFTWVLANPSPNFYFRTHDEVGNPTFSQGELATMRRLVPGIVVALTGRAFTGRLEEGSEPRVRETWISVEQVVLDPGICGQAGVGWAAGLIHMNAAAPDCPFETTFRHEVGHAMGFFHVSDGLGLMYPTVGIAHDFSARESDAARAAYELGRGHPYTDARTMTTLERRALPDGPMAVCPVPER